MKKYFLDNIAHRSGLMTVDIFWFYVDISRSKLATFIDRLKFKITYFEEKPLILNLYNNCYLSLT